MTEALTEAFCERCGTRYTFEPPRAGGLARLRAASRGLADYVLTDHRSLGDAVSDAIGTADAAEGRQRADSFQRTFSFCLDCREYVCPSCWNAAAGRCVTCAASRADVPPVATAEAAGASAAPSPAPDLDGGEDLEDDVIAAAIAAGIIHPPRPGPTPGPDAHAPGPAPEMPEAATEAPGQVSDESDEPDAGEMALRLATLPTIGSQTIDRPVGRPSFAAGTDQVGDDPGAVVPPPWPSADDTGAADADPAAAARARNDISWPAFDETRAVDPVPAPEAAEVPWPGVDETRDAVVGAEAGEPAHEPLPPAGPTAAPPSDAPVAGPVPAPAGGARMIGRPSVPDSRLGAPKACVGCGLQLAAATRFCRRCGARQD